MSWSSGFKPEHEESKGKGGESAGLRWFKAPCIFSIWRTSLVTESMAHWGVKEAICSLPLDRLQNQLTSRRQENKIHLNRSFNLVSFIFVLKKKKSQADFFSAIILTELITPQGVWNSTSESVWIRFFQLNIHPSIHYLYPLVGSQRSSGESRVHMDRSPVNHRATQRLTRQTNTHTLKLTPKDNFRVTN